MRLFREIIHDIRARREAEEMHREALKAHEALQALAKSLPFHELYGARELRERLNQMTGGGLGIDYAAMEMEFARRFAEGERFVFGRASQGLTPVMQIHDELVGENPCAEVDLDSNIDPNSKPPRRYIHISGFSGTLLLTKNDDRDRGARPVVETIGVPFKNQELLKGWDVECCHYRRFRDCLSGKIVLIRLGKEQELLPHSVTYNYKDQPGITTFAGDFQEPMATGGLTQVVISSPEGYWADGIATCSDSDQFSKKTGRDLALARAVNKLNETMNR